MLRNGRAIPSGCIIRNDHAFSPEEADILIGALPGIAQGAELTDREDPLTLLVAKKILELAKEGERDRVRLREAAVASFR